MENKNHIFMIAEGACNHNGSLKIAEELVRRAKACGADAIKFQAFSVDNLIRKSMKKAAHLKNMGEDDSVFGAMKKLELNRQDFLHLDRASGKEDIIMFASVFDLESLKLAEALDFPIIKIPSGEIVNLELLEAAAKLGKPIILSTGLSTLEEVKRAVGIISKNLKVGHGGNKDITGKFPLFKNRLILMHTVSTYPSSAQELNLRAITTLRSAFGLPVGYSDHSIGDDACLASVALGAVMIEKHFTLDKDMEGPDHKASIEPDEMKRLISKIDNVSKMLGNGVKMPSRSEKGMVNLFRKAIVAKVDIKKGQVIKRDMLILQRPLDGIACEKMPEILGLRTKTDIKSGQPIKWKDVAVTA